MSIAVDSRVRQARRCVAERLLDERGADGHWAGELSASALSTATAVFALSCVERRRGSEDLRGLIDRGCEWLARHQNDDGGWGDTVTSPSNLSTTALCWAALSARVEPWVETQGYTRSPLRGEERPAGPSFFVPEGRPLGAPASCRLFVPEGRPHLALGFNPGNSTTAIPRAEAWIRRRVGGLDREVLSPAIQALYGDDRTFSVPILTMCALAGRLGDGPEPWRDIPALPFELALFPRRWFKSLGLPVVSYALPALIAIGQTQHHHCPARWAPWRWLRERSRRPTLDLLASIQPASGGFLEAVPLTSFAAMSLATCGEVDDPVVGRAVDFLAASIRDDGSWPIDVNLATWVSTLCVNALGDDFNGGDRGGLVDWLLAQHHVEVHPFTQADPGGWAWTDLSGGVPDADDTSGALLALARLAPDAARVRSAAALGVSWLLDLQNRDGGIPTFCRGWGKLPFDRSSPDLTAHALRAWHAWRGRLPASIERRVERATRRAVSYLRRCQRGDGSWVPLWFGNQAAPGNENPTYGTSRVLLALSTAGHADEARQRGTEWLRRIQNLDGGWGGALEVASSPEETALALEALGAGRRRDPSSEIEDVGQRGLHHLLKRIEAGDLERPSPIGLYFADLWYSEKLYPWIFTAAALGRWL